MFGIDATKILAPVAAPVKSVSAVWNSDWNVLVGVISLTFDTHRSLAPISTVRYWTPCEAAVLTWPPSAAMFAPAAASLYSGSEMAELAAPIRRHSPPAE